MSPEPVTDPAVLLAGGVAVPVTALDGTPSTAKVRLLRIKDFAAFLALVDDYEQLAELAVGQPPGWAAGLTPASVLALAESALALNFISVRRWAEHRTQLAALAHAFAHPPSASPSAAASPASAPTPGS